MALHRAISSQSAIESANWDTTPTSASESPALGPITQAQHPKIQRRPPRIIKNKGTPRHWAPIRDSVEAQEIPSSESAGYADTPLPDPAPIARAEPGSPARTATPPAHVGVLLRDGSHGSSRCTRGSSVPSSAGGAPAPVSARAPDDSANSLTHENRLLTAEKRRLTQSEAEKPASEADGARKASHYGASRNSPSPDTDAFAPAEPGDTMPRSKAMHRPSRPAGDTDRGCAALCC